MGGDKIEYYYLLSFLYVTCHFLIFTVVYKGVVITTSIFFQMRKIGLRKYEQLAQGSESTGKPWSVWLPSLLATLGYLPVKAIRSLEITLQRCLWVGGALTLYDFLVSMLHLFSSWNAGWPITVLIPDVSGKIVSLVWVSGHWSGGVSLSWKISVQLSCTYVF